ncbi:hypothetical protein CHS0354_002218 [Potamilus streckersoni]|uniref:Cytochrome P450 n=2 Tax=Potamilus streckersoni TaxID=2493646 RepID=A0AAE0VV67_9BIVA|nr:hypothetical protein CHS0354_002218 [Potamilus streckersoni]
MNPLIFWRNMDRAMSHFRVISMFMIFIYLHDILQKHMTSVGLTWVMLQLAQYPHIQKNVREELKLLIPNPATPLTFEVLDKLHYLTCVIKETMRLFPPVSNITRCAIHDDTISGYRIPAGTVINLHIGALHRMPQNWEDPETFYPERFMEDFGAYKFLPFIAGPHTCIGNKFAMLEMKSVLAVLVRDFEFSMAPGYKYRRVQGVTAKPNPPLLLQVKKICDSCIILQE